MQLNTLKENISDTKLPRLQRCESHYDQKTNDTDLALDFRFGALPVPFSGHSISFARLPVLLFSGHLPVFPQENAFSNNFQKNAAFWKNPENIWLKFGQNSAKFWEILQNFVKISEIFSDF